MLQEVPERSEERLSWLSATLAPTDAGPAAVQELQQLLDELQDGIPQLRSDYPESEDFWAAFYGLVEVGLERAEGQIALHLIWYAADGK